MNKSPCKVDLTLEDHDERGCVARIGVDYKTRLNIINSGSIGKLAEAANSLGDNERLRVLTLTGAGDRAFIGCKSASNLTSLGDRL